MTVAFPPSDLIKSHPEILAFKHTVEEVMRHFPELTPDSWYRDPYANIEAGGKLYSLHMLGLAMDLDWWGASLEDFKRAAALGLALRLSSIIYFTPKKHYIHFQHLPLAVGDVPPQFNILAPTGHTGWIDFLWNVAFGRNRAPEPSIQVKTEDETFQIRAKDAAKILELVFGI